MPVHASNDEDQPLDPAQERLRRKLVRLLFVSGGIMMLGLIAVFAAIVYKLGRAGDGTAGRFAGEAVASRLALPAGSRILSADLDGGRALVLVEAADGGQNLVLIDLASGSVLGLYEATAE